MYRILRYLLMASVLLAAYLAGMVIYLVPYAWLALVVIAFVMLFRKTRRFTAYGTARWAEVSDIPHMLQGNGLIVGQMQGENDRLGTTKGLLDRGISDKAACQKFLLAFQRRPPIHTVRLTNAIHTAVFSPAGGGK